MSTPETVVASIIGFIAAFFLLLYAGSYRMRKAAKAFQSALLARKYSDAYQLLGSDLKGSIQEHEFETFLAERGIFRIKEFRGSDFWIGKKQGGYKPYLIREDGIYFQLELLMRREQWTWKVAVIDVKLRLVQAQAPVRSVEQAEQPSIRPEADARDRKSLH